MLEAGHPWRGPHTRAEVRGWCLTHPYYGENPPNGSVHSTTSFAHICSLNPMQSGLLRPGDIIQTPALVTTGTGQGPGESPGPVSCVARVTCARRSHDTGLSVVSWSSGRADVCKVSSTPIMLSRTLSPSALLLTLSHLASGARETGANVPSDLVTGKPKIKIPTSSGQKIFYVLGRFLKNYQSSSLESD